MATDLGRELAKSQIRVHRQRGEIRALKARLYKYIKDDIKYLQQARIISGIQAQFGKLTKENEKLRHHNATLEYGSHRDELHARDLRIHELVLQLRVFVKMGYPQNVSALFLADELQRYTIKHPFSGNKRLLAKLEAIIVELRKLKV